MNRNRILILTVAMLLVTGAGQQAQAQRVKINFTDQEAVGYDISKIGSIEFEEGTPVETPEWVDLGLPSGTLWATMNVGAASPEECGGFYAWGETETKYTYSWATYSHCDGSYLTMNKYCTDGYYGTVDGLKALEDADDVATTLFGENWSMPTREQFEELFNQDYTTWKRVSRNDVWGILVTSKKTNWSIFLPVGGYRDGKDSYNEDRGYYWTKDLYVGIENLARSLSIDGNSLSTGASNNRRCGLNIRPVYKQPEHEYVDLGLPSGTLWAATNIGAETPENYGNYYAWGETETKDEYNWKSYKLAIFGNEIEDFMSSNDLIKYTGSDYKDEKSDKYAQSLQETDDAATANWGADWQMPDMFQWIELISGEYTTIEYVSLSQYRHGVRITSKSNGNSIFLPLAGYYNENYKITNHAYYWTRNISDLGEKPYLQAYIISYDEKTTDFWNIRLTASHRCLGCSIRPIRKKK